MTESARPALLRLSSGVVHVAVGLVACVMLLSGSAVPASAHGGVAFEAAPSSNWRSRVTNFETPSDEISFAVIDAGEKVELRNSSDRTVTVIGYENEPYLRVGPEGVFENARSPATYLNRSTDGTVPVPETADASAEPEWRRVTSGDAISWHDHRAHWMAADPPPVVTDDPSVERVIYDRWVIPVEVDGERLEVIGDLTWVPGPVAWPWITAVIVLATAIAATAFTSRWRAVVWAGSAILLLSCAIDIVGTWWGSTDPTIERAAALVTPSISFAFLIAGLVYLDRRRQDALMLIFGGAAGVTVFFGWLSRRFLVDSQLPTALSPDLARLTVLVSLGVGIGLMLLVVGLHRDAIRLVFLQRQRQQSAEPRRRSAPIGARPRGAHQATPRRTRRMAIYAAGVASAVVVIVGLVLTTNRADQPGANRGVADPGAGDVLTVSLCSAIASAVNGDVNSTRRTFDEIHDGLHELAKTEAERDRASSARLLEAKQRVESDLATTPVALVEDLRSLHGVIATITPPTSDAGRC